MNESKESGCERLIIGWTCDDCDEAIGDEPSVWDLAERFRKEHEEETGHTTTVEVVHEERILPTMKDRMAVGEAMLDLAEGERIECLCPECLRTGEELETTNRCPDCGEPLREVLPDGGTDGCERWEPVDEACDADELRTLRELRSLHDAYLNEWQVVPHR